MGLFKPLLWNSNFGLHYFKFFFLLSLTGAWILNQVSDTNCRMIVTFEIKLGLEDWIGLIDIENPSLPLFGYDLLRNLWVKHRTNWVICGDSVFRWNFKESYVLWLFVPKYWEYLLAIWVATNRCQTVLQYIFNINSDTFHSSNHINISDIINLKEQATINWIVISRVLLGGLVSAKYERQNSISKNNIFENNIMFDKRQCPKYSKFH